MAVTIEDVCNVALSYIGLRDPILDIDEDSVAAIVAKTHYESSRNAVLGARWWNFAEAGESLARLNITAPIDWAFAYQLPSDLLPGKTRYIQNSVRQARVPPGSQIPFQLRWISGSNQVLLTDHTAPTLVYTRVMELVWWPEGARDALAWHLAPKLALGLAVDLRKGVLFKEEYRRALEEAMAEDMNSVRPDPRQASTFETGRS